MSFELEISFWWWPVISHWIGALKNFQFAVNHFQVAVKCFQIVAKVSNLLRIFSNLMWNFSRKATCCEMTEYLLKCITKIQIQNQKKLWNGSPKDSLQFLRDPLQRELLIGELCNTCYAVKLSWSWTAMKIFDCIKFKTMTNHIYLSNKITLFINFITFLRYYIENFHLVF